MATGGHQQYGKEFEPFRIVISLMYPVATVATSNVVKDLSHSFDESLGLWRFLWLVTFLWVGCNRRGGRFVVHSYENFLFCILLNF